MDDDDKIYDAEIVPDNDTHRHNVVAYMPVPYAWLEDCTFRFNWKYKALVWTPDGECWLTMIPGAN